MAISGTAKNQGRWASAAMGLVASLALCFATAAFGGSFPPGDWYAALSKPAWNPPSAVFAPVWTTLYALMGVAAWLVWRRHDAGGRWPALGWFLLQLLLNALWSPLFFGLHRPDLAFFEICLLWGALLGTVITFWRVRRVAGVLLLPYLAWVSFAAALNLTLWRLNP